MPKGNKDAVELNTAIRKFIYSVTDAPGKLTEIRGVCLDLLTATQWHVVDLKVILKSKDNTALLTSLGNSFDELRTQIEGFKDLKGQDALLRKAGETLVKQKQILQELYSAARLSRK